MGYIFFIGSPGSWCSKKQKVVALTITEAAYLSGTKATKEAIWLRSLSELGLPIIPMNLNEDNQSANALAEYHARRKHIHGIQLYITEMVEPCQIEVAYIPNTEMIAYMLTTPLPRKPWLMPMMGLQLHSGTCTATVVEPWECRTCVTSLNSSNELHQDLNGYDLNYGNGIHSNQSKCMMSVRTLLRN